MTSEQVTLDGFVDARCQHDYHTGSNTYRMVGGCYNCRATLLGMFTTGHETSRMVTCPLCGVYGRAYWKRLATVAEIPAAVGQ